MYDLSDIIRVLSDEVFPFLLKMVDKEVVDQVPYLSAEDRAHCISESLRLCALRLSEIGTVEALPEGRPPKGMLQ